MSINKLSQHAIDHELECPRGKSRVEFCDADLPGLYVELRATTPGRGTFYLRWKDRGGTTRHARIGRTSEVSLAEARSRALKLKAEIRLGVGLGEEKVVREAPTFECFFTDHYMPYVTPRKRSWKSDQLLFQRRIQPVFGDKRLDMITRQQIQKFHTDLKSTGLAPATCDHHVKLLKHALNLAIDWGMLEKNPAARIPLFNADNRREHYVDEEQLQRLMQVLRSDSNRPICCIARFLLSTGARLNEALSARWSDIDEDSRVWRIAAINSKSKRMRSVPLNDAALEVLDELKPGEDEASQRESDHVFMNKKTGKPYRNIAKVWDRLRKDAGLPHLRLHDLRHSFASFLVNSGRSLYEVQQILGHSDSKVTERYSHLSSKTLQDAANSASVAIKGASPAPFPG